MSKSQHQFAFSLSPNTARAGHCLGVNALAIYPQPSSTDEGSGILYTAGKDGAINAWQLNHMNLSHANDLKNEIPLQPLSAGSDQLPSPPSSPVRKPTSRSNSTVPLAKGLIHSNWVNDIALVGAQSDLTVRIWNPWNETQRVVGRHKDYVRCLTRPSKNSNMVVSGGLDCQIIAWDMAEQKQICCISTDSKSHISPGSVYAIGSSSIDSPLVASGGVDPVVRLWDLRADNPRVAKFAGHTDNVRSLLVSDGGEWVLSGSSDSSIKLWSVVAGRLLHTFDIHDDSVWSLFSCHPLLKTFYSSDRSGTVIKTDLRAASDDLPSSLSVVLCQESTAITSVVAAGDFVWTAQSNSDIKRWNNYDIRAVAGQRAREGLSHGRGSIDVDAASTSSASRTLCKSTLSSSISLTTLDANPSSVQPIPSDSGRSKPSFFIGAPMDSHSTSPTASRRPSTNNTALADGLPGDDSTQFLTASGEPYLPHGSLQNSLTAQNVQIHPVNDSPVEVLEGYVGLVKHRLLPDRRHVLTGDSNSNLQLWDLMSGTVTREFKDKQGSDIDAVLETIISESPADSIQNWCQVSTRCGELHVYLHSSTWCDAEVYADEVLDWLEKIHELEPLNRPSSEYKIDQRLNLGKIAVRNLLANLVSAEVALDREYRKSLAGTHHSASASSIDARSVGTASDHLSDTSNDDEANLPAPQLNFALPSSHDHIRDDNSETPSKNDFSDQPPILDDSDIQKPISKTDSHASRARSPVSSRASSADKHSVDNSSSKFKSLFTSLKRSGRTARSRTDAAGSRNISDTSLVTNDTHNSGTGGSGNGGSSSQDNTTMNSSSNGHNSPRPQDPSNKQNENTEPRNLAEVLSSIRKEYPPAGDGVYARGMPATVLRPPSLEDVPLIHYPPQTKIIVYEQLDESEETVDVYRGTVGDAGADHETLETLIPAWIGNLLLRNVLPTKEFVKVSFMLEPAKDTSLPSLRTTNVRLTAYHMLRVRKILGYVVDRMEKTPSQAKSGKPFSEWLQLSCNDKPLDERLTLGQIRARIWRSSSDILITYDVVR